MYKRQAVNGFAGGVRADRVADLQGDPRVLVVEQERLYRLEDDATPTGIDRIEADAGLPVVTSTQAMIWWGMRTIGVTDDVPGFGSLYGVDPAESRN